MTTARISRRRAAGWLLTLTAAWMLTFATANAFGLSQRGHVFAFSYGEKGKGEGELSEPAGVAVNDATGVAYVADHHNKRVVVLKPVLSQQGTLVGEDYAGALAVPSPSSLAVDNSTDGEDPSQGDVYVVGSGGHAVYKFTAEGTPVGEPLKKFVLSEHGITSSAKLEGIEGVAVGAAGELFVWQADGEVFVFDDQQENTPSYSIATGLEGAPGIGVNAAGDLLVGHVSAPGGATVAELEGTTGALLLGELDGEYSSALAVNTRYVSANEADEQNDVYVESVVQSTGGPQATIAQFAPSTGGKPGELIQRFSAPGLSGGSGVAVDETTGAVFVTDAASDQLDVFDLEAAGAPTIDAFSVGAAEHPAASSRRLSAQIDPEGAATEAVFEYGPTGCGAPGACATSTHADLGGGFAEREASFELPALAPGTYHYRVLAQSSLGTASSPERIFTVDTVTTGLPDARAWEMVSPPQKDGAPIEALTYDGGTILAAEDGDALAYVSNGALGAEPEGNRSFEPTQLLATRGPEGWVSQDVATPVARAYGLNDIAPEYRLFSSDLSLALVEPFGAEPYLAPGVAAKMIYLRDDQPIAPGPAESQSYAEAQANAGFMAPGFAPLVTEADAREGFRTAGLAFIDATPDLRHVVFSSSAALTGGSSAAGLYEWSAEGGGLRFVSALPDGQAAPLSALGYYHTLARAISADGSRVIWTNSQSTPGHLYMSETATGQTVQLDAPEAGLGEPSAAAKFQSANVAGTRVFFTDDQALVAGASVEPAREQSDLYECEMSEAAGGLACSLHDLTIPLTPGEHADVQGSPLGVSEDGSTLYLVAQGVLAANENANGEVAETGQDNLYELHDENGEWVRTFIAVLSAEDSADWDAGPNVADEDPAFETARISPDGEYLAFMSERGLTGYDNEDLSSEHPGERLDQEVFLYDAHTASLNCPSCNPTGQRPRGVLDQERSGEGIGLVVDRRQSWRGHWLAGSIPGWTPENLTNALYQSRYLSNEGRLFFNSADPLTEGVADPTREEEINGRTQNVGVENVYEYEPGGVGGCTTPASNGCVALISSATSSKESAFLEATPDGDDVFFLTAARLLPQDTDDAFDIYDARVCTERSPCLSPPEAARASCGSTEQCVPGNPATPAATSSSGTATFSGPGDAATSTPTQQVNSSKTTDKPQTALSPLARALGVCRSSFAHANDRRSACETRARLTAALSSCKARYPHNKQRRAACERHAREAYRARAARRGRSGPGATRLR